jgi:hypothetical protein
MKRFALFLMLLPSFAWAADNPYDEQVSHCFEQQLRQGEWLNDIVSWSKLIVACPDIVTKDSDFCATNATDPAQCTLNLIQDASLSIQLYINPNTHRMDSKMAASLDAHPR